MVDKAIPVTLVPAVQGEPIAKAQHVEQTDNGTILRSDGDRIVASSLVEGSEDIANSKSLSVPGGRGVILGHFTIRSTGSSIGVQDLIDNNRFGLVSHALTDGGKVNYDQTQAQVTTPPAADTSETFTGTTHQFMVTNANAGTATSYAVTRSAGSTTINNCNFIIRRTSHTTNPALVDFKRDVNGGVGFTLQGGASATTTTITLPFQPFFAAGEQLYITVEGDGTTPLNLLGETLSGQEVPAITVIGNPTVNYDLIDREDYTSGDQTKLRALPTDADLDERIRDTVGTTLVGGTNVTVTVDDAADTITLSSSSALTTEQVEDIVGGMVSGNTETGITVNYDDTNGKLNFVVNGMLPAFTQFEIQNQETTVHPGTSFTGSQVFLYAVSNLSNVVGNYTILQGTDVLSAGVDQQGSSSTLTVNNVTLTNAGDSVTWTIRGSNNQAGTFERNFTVTAHATGEFFYYGLSSSNNPADIDITTLTKRLSATESFDFSIGPTTAGQYIILLAPQDHDLTNLVNQAINTDVLQAYTRSVAVRTISSQSYNSYVLGPVNAGFTVSYRGTFA